MGATCTSGLTPTDTHLICASPVGLKYEMAQGWNVMIVNHLWVEDCFRAWECQAVTMPRYTHFPLGVCLDALVGLAPYQPADFYPQQAEEAAPERIETSPVPESDTLEGDLNQPAPSRVPRKAASSATQALIKLMEAQNQYEQATRNKRNGLALPLADELEVNSHRPEPQRPISQTRSSTAKARRETLTTPLRTRAQRVGIVAEESRRIEIVITPRKSRRLELSNWPKTPRRESRVKPKATDIKDVRILFSGCKPTSEETRSIRQMKGRVVESTEECTHLIAQAASRSEKFLCAISRARLIVTPTWLDKSIEAGMFLDEAPFMLLDKKNENFLGFSLSKSLRKAKDKKLFSTYEFIITPSVRPDFQTLASIIRAGGGKVLPSFPPRRLIAPDAKSVIGSELKLLILSCEEDLAHLKSHLPLAFSTNPALFNLYKSELVLSGSLRQELAFAENRIRFKSFS